MGVGQSISEAGKGSGTTGKIQKSDVNAWY